MTTGPKRVQLRSSEWLAISFFAYTAARALIYRDRPHLGIQPLVLLATVAGLYFLLAAAERYRPAVVFSHIRDWVPLGVTLLAFREMDLFRPAVFDHHYEQIWMAQDRWLLSGVHMGRLAGTLASLYFETCYVFTYGIAAICIGLLYGLDRRQLVNRFLLFYLAGTLGVYALFPFFPSEPPRFVYPHELMPEVMTPMRALNLNLLRAATIHVSVFPSAHVSSVFSAAWAFLLLLPERKKYGVVLLVYAASVAVATVYGRYHYAADAVAGLAGSIVAAIVCRIAMRRPPQIRAS